MWRMNKQSGVDVENERVEWMWRMSEWSGCGQYLKRIFICICNYVFLFCIDEHESDV